MKTKLLIFPYGGNSLEALTAIQQKYHFLGFIDDDRKKQGKQKNGYSVFSQTATKKYPKAKVLAVPGNPDTYHLRKKIISGLKVKSNRYATVIHPTAVVSPLAKIGYNVLIMAGVVITSDAVIGNHVCILPNTVIHHGVKIEDYVLIGSNVVVGGDTTIKENCYIGSGSNIINGVTIGNNSLVGLGSNVIHGVKNSSKVVGNPAKYI